MKHRALLRNRKIYGSRSGAGEGTRSAKEEEFGVLIKVERAEDLDGKPLDIK